MSVRVLLVDDSPTFRTLARARLVGEGFEIVGEATTGREGVELTERLRPDIVLMDVQMPELDGYEATRQIMDRAATPVVVVSAPDSGPGIRLSLDALAAGALSAMPKPPGLDHPSHERDWARLVRVLRTMASVRVVRRRRARFSKPPKVTSVEGRAEVVALAASTGGPAALREVLSALPGDFAAPMLVVQHIGDEFTSGFARWLDGRVSTTVAVARHGEPLEPARVYVAPSSAHLAVRGGRVVLRDDPPVGGFRPSANVLFESVADEFAERALAVILTGMGSDGLVGIRRLHERGGRVVAQDRDTSVVHSMPGSAIRAGAADWVLPLDEIAARIMECVG